MKPEKPIDGDKLAKILGGKTGWAASKEIPEVDRMDPKLHRNADTSRKDQGDD